METTRQAVIRLRQELAEAITRRMELDHIAGKVIYMKFLARFGELEIKEHRLRYREMYLSAKIQLMRTFIAQDLPMHLGMIHAELDADLGHYARYIEGMEALWKKSMRQYRAEETMARERESIRELFLLLAGELSPDVHPEADPKRHGLYREAEEAFREGDLMRLRNLHETAIRTRKAERPLPEILLREERLRLEERLREVNAWAQLRETGTPFEYRELVEDEDRIEARIRESQALIEKYEAAVIERQKTVAELLKKYPLAKEDPFTWRES